MTTPGSALCAVCPLIPKDLWGDYDVPGWTANGIEPWGLQPDPIGSTGNLFFRGFFNLMLAIHRAVSREPTWEKPFEMAGLDDRTFAWTHRGIAEYLGNQWAETPHGPHRENTKSWPFCLSAAGRGLQLTDRTLGTTTHWVYDRWVEEAFKKKYMGFDGRGRLKWVALYYDPLLDRVHGDRRLFGLFPSIYVVPQNRALGELLYRNAVASVGWDRPWLPVLAPPSGDPRPLTMGFLMAREYGDHTTARRLGRKLERQANGRFFDATGGADEDEYGHFFRYGEPYPRGQESAFYMLKDLLDGEGDWGRAFAFDATDAEKLSAPTVIGADYPKMGFSVAWNDRARGVLELESFVATRSARGEATRFTVCKLPDPGRVQVLRDGRSYGAWRATGADSIEIESEVGEHRFKIATGYRGGVATGADGATGATGAGGAAFARGGAAGRGESFAFVSGRMASGRRSSGASRVTTAELVTAAASISAACPCCAGVA